MLRDVADKLLEAVPEDQKEALAAWSRAESLDAAYRNVVEIETSVRGSVGFGGNGLQHRLAELSREGKAHHYATADGGSGLQANAFEAVVTALVVADRLAEQSEAAND